MDELAGKGTTERRWLLSLGAALLVGYCAFALAQPNRPGEFSYLSPDEPPFSAMFGFTYEQLQSHLARALLLGPALVFMGLGLAGQRRAFSWTDLGLDRSVDLRRSALVVGAVSVAFSAFVLTAVLHGRAITDDELSYRHQARLLADGRLGDPNLPRMGWEPFTIESRAGQTGKYLFGEPLAQVPGTLVGIPALAHLVFAALTLLVWFAAVRSSNGVPVAAWATILLACSPMFVFTEATGLSHSTSLLCSVATGLGLQYCRRGRPWRGALLAGTALGFGLTVRPQVLLPVGAVFGGWLVFELLRRRQVAALGAFALALAPWLAAIAAYDQALTGSPWDLPWSLYVPHEAMGFDPPHGVERAFSNLAVSAARFNAWWLGLPLGLGVLAVWIRLGRPHRGLAPWAAAGLALIAFNFCYYSPGVSDTGPVYYFELLLPASLLGALTLSAAFARWPRPTASLLLVHLVLGTGSFVAEQSARLTRLHRAIYERVDTVLAGIQTPALLLYEKEADEATAAGWVLSFPLRYRSEHDPVLTFPRRSPEEVMQLRTRWPDRRCYYYRVDPATHRPELRDCSAAEDLLARRRTLSERPGWMPPATASTLGY